MIPISGGAAGPALVHRGRALRRRFPPTGLLPALLLVLFSRPAEVAANGGPVEDWGGNSIAPLQNCNVRLVREWVHVDFDSRRPQVQCRYLLENLVDRDTTITMTFIRGREPGRDFHARIREQEVPVRWVTADFRHWGKYTDGDLDSLPVWDVALGARDTVSVRCRYPTQFEWYDWRDGTVGSFQYRTQAAALWAGTIESAEFVIDLGRDWRYFTCRDFRVPPYVSAQIEPEGFEWVESNLRWRFVDWEPNVDIRLNRFDTEAMSSGAYLNCAPGTSAECDPLELPAYASDSIALTRDSVLDAIRRGFVERGPDPLPQNYRAFALAFLQAMRIEIDAHRGAPIPSIGWAQHFEWEPWYEPRADFSPSDLSPVERANATLLLELEQEVDADPRLLLPLPEGDLRAPWSIE